MSTLRIPLPPVPVVHMWLSVYEKRCPMGVDALWTRDLVTYFPPRDGDQIHLSVSEEDDSDDVAWHIFKHYWSWDGGYHVELTKMVVDPEDTSWGSPFYAASWWTSTEGGRPEPMLRRGGWKLYGDTNA